MVIIVGVSKEVSAHSKDVGRADVRRRKLGLGGFLDFIHFLGIVAEILAQLVSQIGVDITVTHDLECLVHTDTSVIRSDENGIFAIGQEFQQVTHGRMAEPRKCDATIGSLISGDYN